LTLEVTSQYDPVYGGFGNTLKFPLSEALRFLLLRHHLEGHEAALRMVTKTLTVMRSGGIYDNVEGGFFRYSTTRDWSILHYEKMCEDNAKLLVNYLEAYQVTCEVFFRDGAKDIIGYVNGSLSDRENGGFYGSQDADEHYYRLSREERVKLTPPKIDRTVFVDWNGMMISAYLLASAVIGYQYNKEFALRSLMRILEEGFSPTDGFRHYLSGDEESVPSGLLTDQAWMLRCLIDAYEVTSDKKFLEKAEGLAEFVLEKLLDGAGGFYDKPEEGSSLGALKLLDKPLYENSVAMDGLLRLHHLTGKQKFFEVAEHALKFFASRYQRYSIMGSVYGLAVARYIYPIQIHIVGTLKDELTQILRAECLKTYNPLKTVEVVDPEVDGERLETLGYPVRDAPTAYVCFGGECSSAEKPGEIQVLVAGRKKRGR